MSINDPIPPGLGSPRVAWVFLDESGTPDFDSTAQSPYFAFGSATFTQSRPIPFKPYHDVREQRRGILNGFHAYNDSRDTRTAFFNMMADNPAHYEATFMLKENAFGYVKQRPKIWMYKYTLFRHLQQVIASLRAQVDTINVVAAHINMDAKQDAVRHSIEDVCAQLGGPTNVAVHIWKAPSSAGLQIADYALWAIQRQLFKGDCREFDMSVKPHLRNVHYPWGVKRA